MNIWKPHDPQKVSLQLWNDENGFIISAELLLVSTILVIGLVAGLSEVQHSVTQELNDVGEAFGSMNQSYYYSGFRATKGFGGLNGFGNCGGLKSFTAGSFFSDRQDACDRNECLISCAGATGECSKGFNGCDRGLQSWGTSSGPAVSGAVNSQGTAPVLEHRILSAPSAEQ